MSPRNGTGCNIQRNGKSLESIPLQNTDFLFLQHYGYFADAINYITTTKGAYTILDPHNYMRYNDPSQQPGTGSIIGDTSDSKAATTAQFGEFWGELAGRFKDNEKVIFGLNNEVSIRPQSQRRE